MSDNTDTISISTSHYQLSLTFYSYNSNDCIDFLNSVCNDEQRNYIESLKAPTPSHSEAKLLIVCHRPGSLGDYGPSYLKSDLNNVTPIPVNFTIYILSDDSTINSFNESNAQSIFNSIVVNLHNTMAGVELKEKHARLLQNGVVNLFGKATYKHAMYFVDARYLGTYEQITKPYPFCHFYSNDIAVVSPEYPYANPARYATCSCPNMISASTAKDVPVRCLWDNQQSCMFYAPNQKVIIENNIFPKIDTATPLQVRLVSQTLSNFTESVSIVCYDKPVVNFDTKSSDFNIDSCIDVFNDYVNDIKQVDAPKIDIKQKSSSSFLSGLALEE